MGRRERGGREEGRKQREVGERKEGRRGIEGEGEGDRKWEMLVGEGQG